MHFANNNNNIILIKMACLFLKNYHVYTKKENMGNITYNP